MKRYMQGIVTGSLVGAAVGIYFLLRSKRLLNIVRRIRLRAPVEKANVSSIEIKRRGIRPEIKKSSRVFAKRLVR